MNFELKVQAPKNAPVVWNYDELKTNLTTALADYQNRIYTEDTIAEAKEDRAKLNKLAKAINDERISREKEYMQPFNTFKDQANELCDLINQASAGIKEQLDSFEEKRVAEKTADIQALFDDIASNYDLPFITLDKVFNQKWLNKSTTDKAITEEITERFEKAVLDIQVIRKMPKYAFEAEEAYKQSLDLNRSLEEGERMADIQDKKQAVVANDSGERYEISFKCSLTIDQAKALKAFCKANGIELKQI